MLVAAAATVTAIACGQTDAGISTAVKSKLAADDTVKAYQIDVDTSDKVVTLTGAVDTANAKQQAVTIARNTDGVRDVVDRLTVDPRAAATTGDLDDAARDAEREIREGTQEARDAAARAGREAREEGREAAEQAKDAARDASAQADAAGDRAEALISDAAITSSVKAKLLADTTVSGLKIDVDTRDGVVTLNGTVDSRAEAERAASLARKTDGVKRVINNTKTSR